MSDNQKCLVVKENDQYFCNLHKINTISDKREPGTVFITKTLTHLSLELKATFCGIRAACLRFYR